MYYRVKDNIGLRKWQKVDRAYYIKGVDNAQGLTKEEWDYVLLCDCNHDIEPNDIINKLLDKGIIEKCNKGEEVSDWSKLKEYDNLYFPKMNLMITGKCNYNCRHCFNAKDNALLNSEWDYDSLVNLIQDACEIGVHAFTITGGEPFVHPRFLDIIKEIYKRNMHVFELNTNGYFITEEILEELRGIGCKPLIKISFDGLGHHDWMRNHKGAEERTINAIKLCIRYGFKVGVQMQVHRGNIDTVLETCLFMASLGCFEVRLIRTTEVKRWLDNNGGLMLPMDEYYDEMIKFSKEYMDSGKRMIVTVWQLFNLYPKEKSYTLIPVLMGCDSFKVTYPRCRGNRGMIAITSSGEVVPCMQMSGGFEEFDIHVGNVHKDKLKDIINSKIFYQYVCEPILNYALNNDLCLNCEYFRVCHGGCVALGVLSSPDKHNYYHEDISKCLFFKNGYYEKVVGKLDGYKLSNPIYYNKELNRYERNK